MQKITDFKLLRRKANEMRISVIEMLDKAGSGHVGGALGMADIFTYVYYNFANIDPSNPKWEDRDRILLSNGHICPILYAILADLGYFDNAELNRLRQVDGILQGHPVLGSAPGIENTSGMLGHGLSQAVGLALALKMDKKKSRVICFTSDGEQQEGQTWEAAMAASKFKLDNLFLIMSNDGLQIEGKIDRIMPEGSLKEKYESFGWDAIEVNGYDFEQISAVLALADKLDRPTVIIAHTVLGKGVSFMENNFKYHDWKGEPGDTEKAIAELREVIDRNN